jgi:SAM-dependent MidA family methyltransferase
VRDASAAAYLRELIERDGPISFERFMEAALYHPAFGYYRRARDPFGREGDFYTAAQLQPVFGILLRAIFESLTPHRTIADIGAGRGELAETFREWRYIPVDYGDPLPAPFDGILFANELFDALPCRAFGSIGESKVSFTNGRFTWTEPPVREECPSVQAVLGSMAAALRCGFAVVIDYGYEDSERALRFPNGSLMSYRRHQACDDVLDSPGDRDITAHVNFTRLIAEAGDLGWKLIAKEKLSSFLLRAGEDAMEAARRADAGKLKALLFAFGERFDALLFEPDARPENIG